MSLALLDMWAVDVQDVQRTAVTDQMQRCGIDVKDVVVGCLQA
jgi:hypothetical protein